MVCGASRIVFDEGDFLLEKHTNVVHSMKNF
jgi:hypothetical protein